MTKTGIFLLVVAGALQQTGCSSSATTAASGPGVVGRPPKPSEDLDYLCARDPASGFLVVAYSSGEVKAGPVFTKIPVSGVTRDLIEWENPYWRTPIQHSVTKVPSWVARSMIAVTRSFVGSGSSTIRVHDTTLEVQCCDNPSGVTIEGGVERDTLRRLTESIIGVTRGISDVSLRPGPIAFGIAVSADSKAGAHRAESMLAFCSKAEGAACYLVACNTTQTQALTLRTVQFELAFSELSAVVAACSGEEYTFDGCDSSEFTEIWIWDGAHTRRLRCSWRSRLMLELIERLHPTPAP